MKGKTSFHSESSSALPFLAGKYLLIILSVFLTNCQSNYTNAYTANNKNDTISIALDNLVSEGKVTGISAAIISDTGLVEITSAGVRKVGTGISFTGNDLVHLGSCTKAMTATMIATLVSDGMLSWDTRLIDAIPEIEDIIHSDYTTITLWQLLTHSAGLPRNPSDWSAYKKKEIKERRLAILIENLEYPLSINRGTFHYSNFGYMVAACMAENVSGLSWESLMKERLFNPLGMSTAGFGDPLKSRRAGQPWGHKKIFGKWVPSRDYYAESLGPAGEVHCSIADWGKFLALQLDASSLFLDSTYLNKLVEPTTGFYAGGWGVAENDWARGKVLSHNGSNEIWFSSVIVAPELRRAYIVVTNSCDFGISEAVCNEILNTLIKKNA